MIKLNKFNSLKIYAMSKQIKQQQRYPQHMMESLKNFIIMWMIYVKWGIIWQRLNQRMMQVHKQLKKAHHPHPHQMKKTLKRVLNNTDTLLCMISIIIIMSIMYPQVIQKHQQLQLLDTLRRNTQSTSMRSGAQEKLEE